MIQFFSLNPTRPNVYLQITIFETISLNSVEAGMGQIRARGYVCTHAPLKRTHMIPVHHIFHHIFADKVLPNLTSSRRGYQVLRRAYGVLLRAYGVLRRAYEVLRRAYGVLRRAYGVPSRESS